MKYINTRNDLIHKFNINRVLLIPLILIFFIFGCINTIGFRINATSYFEVLFVSFLFVISFKRKINIKFLKFNIFILFYIIFSLFYAVFFNNKNLFDFMVIYKFLYYSLILGVFYKQNIFTQLDVGKMYKILISLFLIFYAIQKLLLGVVRPEVVGENNYELVFLCGMFFLVNLNLKNIDYLYFFLLGVVIFLSGSRSAASIYLLGTLILFINNIFTLKNIVLLLALLAAGFGFYSIFVSRLTGGIEDIDRFKMLEMFIYSVRNWDIVNWLFGVERISALPQEVCYSLKYYENLFSYSKDGTCYSVILHAFNLRVIYDHGLLIFLGIFIYIWIILSNRLAVKSRFFIIISIILTGMSVSALNNIYVAMLLAISSSFFIKNELITTSKYK